MDDVQFSLEEITGLAQELSTLATLTPEQRQLLLAIFAAAADRATPATTPGKASLPAIGIKPLTSESGASTPVDPADLKQQLLNAYVPGNDFTDVTEPPKSGKITPTHPAGSGGHP